MTDHTYFYEAEKSISESDVLSEFSMHLLLWTKIFSQNQTQKDSERT